MGVAVDKILMYTVDKSSKLLFFSLVSFLEDTEDGVNKYSDPEAQLRSAFMIYHV